MSSETVLAKAQNLSQGKVHWQGRQILEKAALDNPDFFLYWDRLGDIYQREGDWVSAKRAFEIALSIKPDAGWLNIKLRNVTRNGGMRQNAEQKRIVKGYAQATASEPKSPSNTPVVTVVTVVYNNKSTMQRCIDSVKRQSYPNVEYIVIDGGSTDGTLDVIRRNEDSISYFVSEPDGGIYSAMNKGIRMARGEFICLLNSDDYYEEDFIAEAVDVALSNCSDIVYTDYYAGSSRLRSAPIGPGVFLGHLNICHNACLVRRTAYDNIGLYREDFRIVSDAVWLRNAFDAHLKFDHLPRALFTLTEGGASSGATPAQRRLFIDEMVKTYRLRFPWLAEEEAEEIYLFRFNKNRIHTILSIAAKYGDRDECFFEAIRGYTEYCFQYRENFRLSADSKSDQTIFSAVLRLADLLDFDLKSIQMKTKFGDYSGILEKIDKVLLMRKANAKRTVLHFLTVFSAPSETFIYDLVRRLEDESDYDNFVLYEHSKLEDERRYDKKLRVAWRELGDEISSSIYKYILDSLKPDVVIAHFAINAHRFEERISAFHLDLPMIVMTHGIDVFKLKEISEYSRYVINELSTRSNIKFTAVSHYLKKELINSGISENKITVIPNSVHPRFFRNRKSRDFYRGNRKLKLLSIGRIIGWKGHRYLVEALSKFRNDYSDKFKLSIVYGGGGDELELIQGKIDEYGLSSHIELIPFVDFAKEQDFHSRFDCFIHPSTYSDDGLKKSETFGVAVLEAVAAGLPVISTDAGGLPEVLGYDSQFSRIVPHANSRAICEALKGFCDGYSAFDDNREYATERLAKFSNEAQLNSLVSLIETTSKPIKVALFSTSTRQGAGYAAYRLHKGLLTTSIAPTLFTASGQDEGCAGVRVIRHPSGREAGWFERQRKPKEGKTIFTLEHSVFSRKELKRLLSGFDVVNLHWYARFLSTENVAAISQMEAPVVITVRDMYPITGGCHYFHGCNEWQTTCAKCPQVPTAAALDPADVLDIKRSDFDFTNITLVALSNHTKQIIERVPRFSNCRIEVIPNSIEIDVFRPHNKLDVRREFGLPTDRKIIGYVPSYSSEVKGYRELIDALHLISGDCEFNPYVMLIGNETPATEGIPLEKMSLGYISDNERLARAYSAADLIVVPSLEETFSNTTAEAISCGVPVVGFKTGAIPDLVIDGRTGYTFEVGDVPGLAEGIRRVFSGSDMGVECRRLAEEVLEFNQQARRYEGLYLDLVEKAKTRKNAR